MKLKERVTDRLLHYYALQALKNADPKISKFPVGAAGLVSGRTVRLVATGWNQEMASGDSLHAEESLVAKLRQGEELLRVMIVGGNGQPLAPCGNCRDVLLARANPKAEALVSTPDGQTWLNIKDLLPQTSQGTDDIEKLQSDNIYLELYKLALKIMQGKHYNYYTGKREVAALVTAQGNMYGAPRRDDAAFHHRTAVDRALDLAFHKGEQDIRLVLFMRDKKNYFALGSAFPSGQERQSLYEAGQYKPGFDLPIIGTFSFYQGNAGGILFHSTINTLLPFAFGPRNLGIDPAAEAD